MEKIDSLNENGVWVAKSSDDIQRLVEEMACPVPPRGKGPDGRKSEDVERYSMAVLLGAIASYRLIPPFEVRTGERPDFVIKSNYEEIGIEHTEVVDPKEAEAVALKNSKKHKSNIESGPAFSDGDGECAFCDPGEGYAGNGVERRWVDEIAKRVARKRDSAQKDGFCMYDKNWLMVYFNILLPSVAYGIASEMLRERLSSDGVFSVFCSVYVVDEQAVCEIFEDGFRVFMR